jgi:pimeloyl-ACP methyl ester carboxylesterase
VADVVANGVRFHVQRLAGRAGPAGSPPAARTAPVVFLHGLGLDNLSSFYYTLANPVANAGIEAILYDLRGHGLSERPPTGYAVSDSVSDLDALLGALGVTEPVHLVGNSYGGTVALGFAVAYPDRVASLVLVEAHFAVQGWGAQMAGTLTEVAFGLAEGDARTWRDRHGRKLGRLAANADALINGTTLVDDLLAVKPFPATALRAVTCPVVAVYGESSDVLHHAHQLEGLLPRFSLTVLSGCTHSVLTEATPFLRDALLQWVTAGRVAADVVGEVLAR